MRVAARARGRNIFPRPGEHSCVWTDLCRSRRACAGAKKSRRDDYFHAFKDLCTGRSRRAHAAAKFSLAEANICVLGQIYAGRGARAGAKFCPALANIFVFTHIYAGRGARARAQNSPAEVNIFVFSRIYAGRGL